MLKQFLVQNVETPARVVDGVAVVITPTDAMLHTLNDVGTFIWSRADGRRRLEDIVAEVVAEYEVSQAAALRDAEAFVSSCVRLGLMHLSDVPEPVDLSSVLPGAKLV